MAVIKMTDLKPGDWTLRDFEQQDSGSLDIEKVILDTDYNVVDSEGNNTVNPGKYIEVEFYTMWTSMMGLFTIPLAELKVISLEVMYEHIFYLDFGEKGLPSRGQRI